MKTAILSLVVVVVCGSYAAAQQPRGNQRPTAQLQPAAVTPEMWYYSQERQRHDDPQQAVRRKAEQASEQRAARIAAMKWYGMSNSRPVASTTPFMGVYSPAWVGNGGDRYDWVGLGWGRTGYTGPALTWR
jgi:hypothetical protein